MNIHDGDFSDMGEFGQEPEKRPQFGDRWNASAPQDEILSLGRVEEMKEKLEAARTVVLALELALQTEKNILFRLRARRAPITRLPDDVLSLIFAHGADILQPLVSSDEEKAPRTRRPPFQLVCAQVCDRWRRVAFHTAEVWSSFRITNMSSLLFAKSFIKQVPFVFSLVLNISCFDAIKSPSDPSLRLTLCDLLYSNADRIVSLRSEMCTRGLGHLFLGMSYSFPRLCSIVMCPQDAECSCRFRSFAHRPWNGAGIASAPSLRTLVFKACDLPSTMHTFPTISKLVLSGVRTVADTLAQFLNGFPNLQELHMCHLQLANHVSESNTVATFWTLGQLKTLVLSGDIAVFLETSSASPIPTLEHLILVDLWTSDDEIWELLYLAGSLTALTIACPLTGFAIVNAINESGDGSSSPLLPQLQFLSVSAPGNLRGRGTHFDETVAAALSILVKDRLHSPCALERLRLSPRLTRADKNALFQGQVRVEHFN